MPKQNTNWTTPVVILLALMLMGIAVGMWGQDRIFAAMVGTTGILVMISTTIIGIRQARLDRLEQHIVLSGFAPVRLKSNKRY